MTDREQFHGNLGRKDEDLSSQQLVDADQRLATRVESRLKKIKEQLRINPLDFPSAARDRFIDVSQKEITTLEQLGADVQQIADLRGNLSTLETHIQAAVEVENHQKNIEDVIASIEGAITELSTADGEALKQFIGEKSIESVLGQLSKRLSEVPTLFPAVRTTNEALTALLKKWRDSQPNLTDDAVEERKIDFQTTQDQLDSLHAKLAQITSESLKRKINIFEAEKTLSAAEAAFSQLLSDVQGMLDTAVNVDTADQLTNAHVDLYNRFNLIANSLFGLDAHIVIPDHLRELRISCSAKLAEIRHLSNEATEFLRIENLLTGYKEKIAGIPDQLASLGDTYDDVVRAYDSIEKIEAEMRKQTYSKDFELTEQQKGSITALLSELTAKLQPLRDSYLASYGDFQNTFPDLATKAPHELQLAALQDLFLLNLQADVEKKRATLKDKISGLQARLEEITAYQDGVSQPALAKHIQLYAKEYQNALDQYDQLLSAMPAEGAAVAVSEEAGVENLPKDPASAVDASKLPELDLEVAADPISGEQRGGDKTAEVVVDAEVEVPNQESAREWEVQINQVLQQIQAFYDSEQENLNGYLNAPENIAARRSEAKKLRDNLNAALFKVPEAAAQLPKQDNKYVNLIEIARQRLLYLDNVYHIAEDVFIAAVDLESVRFSKFNNIVSLNALVSKFAELNRCLETYNPLSETIQRLRLSDEVRSRILEIFKKNVFEIGKDAGKDIDRVMSDLFKDSIPEDAPPWMDIPEQLVADQKKIAVMRKVLEIHEFSIQYDQEEMYKVLDLLQREFPDYQEGIAEVEALLASKKRIIEEAGILIDQHHLKIAKRVLERGDISDLTDNERLVWNNRRELKKQQELETASELFFLDFANYLEEKNLRADQIALPASELPKLEHIIASLASKSGDVKLIGDLQAMYDASLHAAGEVNYTTKCVRCGTALSQLVTPACPHCGTDIELLNPLQRVARFFQNNSHANNGKQFLREVESWKRLSHLEDATPAQQSRGAREEMGAENVPDAAKRKEYQIRIAQILGLPAVDDVGDLGAEQAAVEKGLALPDFGQAGLRSEINAILHRINTLISNEINNPAEAKTLYASVASDVDSRTKNVLEANVDSARDVAAAIADLQELQYLNYAMYRFIASKKSSATAIQTIQQRYLEATARVRLRLKSLYEKM